MDVFQLMPALAASIAIVALCLYLAALPRPIPGIPYHRQARLTPLGDALSFLAYRNREGDMFGLLPLRLRQMNTPIMQIFVQPLARPFVVVSDPQEAFDVMMRRAREFDRSRYFELILSPLMPNNHLHFPTDARWKAHRWLIRDIMAPTFLHQVAGPLFWTTAQDMIRLWRLKMQLTEGRPFPAATDIHATALEVIWHAVFGAETRALKTQIELLSGLSSHDARSSSSDSPVDFPRAKNPIAFDAVMTLTDSLDIPINSIAPKLHHTFALRTSPKLRASTKQKDEYIKQSLTQAAHRMAHFKTDEDTDKRYTSVVDLVVHREQILAGKEDRQPSATIADELLGLLFAGHDTTSTTICWAIKFLTAEQRVQTKLRAALRASHTKDASRSQQPSIECIISGGIPYLDATIAEIHRKALTVPAVSRTSTADTTILGHHIPKGTTVFFINSGPGIQTPAMHVDDSRRSQTSLQAKEKHTSWDHESIGQFIPERWLKTDGDGRQVFDGNAGPSLPFGAGQRACFGRNWAQLELRVILTLIIWNFELQPLPDQLASFKAVDKIAHRPQQCYVRLAAAV